MFSYSFYKTKQYHPCSQATDTRFFWIEIHFKSLLNNKQSGRILGEPIQKTNNYPEVEMLDNALPSMVIFG